MVQKSGMILAKFDFKEMFMLFAKLPALSCLLVLLLSSSALSSTFSNAGEPGYFAFWLLENERDFDHYLRVKVELGDGPEKLPMDTHMIFTSGKFDQQLEEQRGSIAEEGAVIKVNSGKTLDLMLIKFPVNARLVLSLETKDGIIVPTYYGQQQFSYTPRDHSYFTCGSCHEYVVDDTTVFRIAISRDY